MRRLVVGTISTLSVFLVAVTVLTACGSENGAIETTTTTTGSEAVVLSIEEALKADPGSTILVEGALVAPRGSSATQMVLASALLESYPPQAGGATVALAGLNLDDLVGLTSTSDQPDLAQVTWSDYWFVLGGVIDDGVLRVQTVPRVVTAAAADARVRFSPVSEPVKSGDTVWWAFDIQNEGSTVLRLTFSSGQRGEVLLAQGGLERYRWSEGMAFTQAIEEVTVAPGETWSVVLNGSLTVPPGDYDLTATIVAGIGADGGGQTTTLPPIMTTIRVY